MQNALAIIFFILFVYFSLKTIISVFRQRSKVKQYAFISLGALIVFINIIPATPKNSKEPAAKAEQAAQPIDPMKEPSEASAQPSEEAQSIQKQEPKANTQANSQQPEVQQTQKPENKFEIIKVSASKLYEDYDVNAVSADKTYFWKALLVTGTAYAVRRDEEANIILELESGNSVYPVYALMAEDQMNNVLEIKRGTIVSLLCYGDSAVNGSPVVSNCRIKSVL